MNLAELVAEMAKLSVEKLSEQRFGKRRMKASAATLPISEGNISTPDVGVDSPMAHSDKSIVEQAENSGAGVTRYISRAARHYLWQTAQGQCANCGSKRDLQVDHVQPFARGGDSELNNLQLLCRSCNIRRGVLNFSTTAMKRV